MGDAADWQLEQMMMPDDDSREEFEPGDPKATEPDWSRECEVCGQTPVVPVTGLCGPCTFGEAETAGGNW